MKTADPGKGFDFEGLVTRAITNGHVDPTPKERARLALCHALQEVCVAANIKDLSTQNVLEVIAIFLGISIYNNAVGPTARLLILKELLLATTQVAMYGGFVDGPKLPKRLEKD